MSKEAKIYAFLGFALAVFTWAFPFSSFFGTSNGAAPIVSSVHAGHKIHGTTRLAITGTGVKVELRVSSKNIPYKGGVISATGTQQVVYLPVGQVLDLDISGTGVTLYIQEQLLEQISISDHGTGTTVHEF